MDFRYAVNLLGRPADDPDVRALLERLKIIREPQIEVAGDETENAQDWLINRRLGVELGFEMRWMAFGEGALAEGGDALVLAQVYFYAHHHAVAPYDGRFPFDITLDDDREAVRRRMAAHERTRRSYIRDTWEPPAFRFTVGYVDDGARVEFVVCLLRPPPLPADADDAALVPAIDLIAGVVGKSLDDPELRLVFAPLRLGPRLEADEDGSSADLTTHFGLALAFGHTTGSRDLVLTTASFYREHEMDGVRWPGALPYGLGFDDSPEAMFKKVGRRPDEHLDEAFIGYAIWHLPAWTLQVMYSSMENFILRVQLMAPGSFDIDEDDDDDDSPLGD